VLPRNESAVLQNVNAALARLTLPSLQSLQDVLGGASGHVLSYRELDHYECERQEPYLGVPDLSYGAPPQWPAGDGPRIIAYLRPIRQLAQILTALSRCRARVLLRIGDVAATGLESYLRPGLVIVDRPVNMLQAARDCDAFVSYASHGFVAEMLLAGKPGLLLPELLERNLVARRAGQLGATLAPPAQGAFNLSQALERVIEDGSLRAAAERFAARYRGQDRSAIPGDLADQLLQSLSRASPARPVVP
jgi:UDP:flavonoid glycosyltransferase YjiC (YdhE family)